MQRAAQRAAQLALRLHGEQREQHESAAGRREAERRGPARWVATSLCGCLRSLRAGLRDFQKENPKYQ